MVRKVRSLVTLGIRSKVILVPAAMLVLAVSSNVILVAGRFRADYSRSLQASVHVIADNLKLQMERLFELGFQLYEISGFDEQCVEVLRQHPHVSYACIADTSGRILFSSRKGKSPVLPVGAWTGSSDPKPQLIRDEQAEDHYAVAAPIADTYGKTIAWAVVAFPRKVLDERIGAMTVWLSGVSALSIGVTAVLLWLALSILVTRPISSLLSAIFEIRSSGDLSREVAVASRDELGQLGASFNALLQSIRDRDAQIQKHLGELRRARDELELRVQERTADLTKANRELQEEIVRRKEAEEKREQMHAILVEASRRAGMAEVATGVLHNVGNVLNSVNVAAQLAQDRIKNSQIASLLKAAELINQHNQDLTQFLTSDDRGRQLPRFLCKLAEVLEQERSQTLLELEGLVKSVNHMKEIVSMQQSLARVAGVITEARVSEIVEDALKINQAGLQRHEVTVQRDYADDMIIHTDKHKVLKILINLISNAKYALTHGGKAEKLLTLRIARGDDQTVKIIVSDNGVGIEPHNMSKIFSHGFTTKKDGHGFGLHSSAIAARELGGSITAHSDGPGAGATFTLTLPIRAGEQQQCPQATATSSVESL